MLRRAGSIALWIIVAGFLLGLGRFLYLRFSSGEIYPPYSSFRADPLGAKAFFESLRRLEGLHISRNLESLQKLDAGPNTTLLLAGASPLAALATSTNRLHEFARNGARVVICIDAAPSHRLEREEDRINRPELPDGRRRRDTPIDTPARLSGLPLKLIDPLRHDTNRLQALLVSDSAHSLPKTLPWFGRYCFDPDDDWRTIYEVKEKPVVVEKTIGLGTLVLCADSYLLSNEALLHHPSPDFLLWLLGGSGTVFFEETHLGIHRGSSIMVALREYRLEGLFLGLLVVAALWIWKSSSTFIPRYSPDSTLQADVEGRTAREAVLHLLERNIPPDELPMVCFREWCKSHPNPNEFQNARVAEARALLDRYTSRPGKERNPVETYHAITNILSPSKT